MNRFGGRLQLMTYKQAFSQAAVQPSKGRPCCSSQNWEIFDGLFWAAIYELLCLM